MARRRADAQLGWAVGLTLALSLAPDPLSAQSLAIDGGVTIVGQLIDDHRVRDEVVSSVDLFVALPLGRFEVAAYAEGNTTPFRGGVSELVSEANTDAGTALGRARRGRLQMSELRLVTSVATLRAHVGLLDATGFLDVSRIANDENLFFLGVPFVNNPTIAFPDYALGFALEGALPHASPLRVGAVVSSSHGLANNAGVSYAELVDLNGEGKGVFAGATIRWVTPGPRASIGGWVSTAEHSRLDGSAGSRGNGGLFTVVGWSNGAHSWSARFGAANEEVSKARAFLGLTYVLTREAGALGLAIARSSAAPEPATLEDVTHGEVFARKRIVGMTFVTLSIQSITNSGFNASTSTVASRIWIGGMRLTAVF